MRGATFWYWTFVVITTTLVTLLVIAFPQWTLITLAAVLVLVVFGLIGDWWRRVYVLALILLVAGSSHIESLATLGGYGKFAGVGLLVLATIFTGKSQKPQGGPLAPPRHQAQKFMLGVLWLTAALAAASVIWSAYRIEAALSAASFAALVFVLHKVSNTRWQGRSKMRGDLLAAYVVMLTAIAVGTVMGAASMGDSVLLNGRHQGLFNNPNQLGMMAVLTFCLGLSIAGDSTRKPLPSLLGYAALVIPAVAVVQSGSRTAILALAAAVAWVFIRRGVISTIVTVTVGIIAVLVLELMNLNPLGSAADRFTAMEGGDVLNQRGGVWNDVLSSLQVNPLGVGWGTTQVALENAYASGLARSGLNSVHNSYVQIVYELGWIALPLAILLIVGLVWVVFAANVRGMGGGLVAVAVAGSLIHWTESAVFGVGQPYPYLFWFAVFAALVNTDPKPAKERKQRRLGKFYTIEPGSGKVRAGARGTWKPAKFYTLKSGSIQGVRK